MEILLLKINFNLAQRNEEDHVVSKSDNSAMFASSHPAFFSRHDAHSLASHILRVIKAQRSIVATQDRRDGHRRAQFRRETGPSARGSCTCVLILAKGDMSSALVARVPDAPSRAVDDGAQRGLLEHHTGILAPRPPEVVRAVADAVAGRCGHVTVVEYVVGSTA